ncbi:MAG: diguanylate cyclase [Alteraurantiacibacter sp.]
MPPGRTIRDITVGCTLWLVLAVASLALRDWLGGMLLLWAPAGVLVATLLLVRRRHWWLVGAALLPVQAGTVVAFGFPVPTAFAYSGAALLQGFVCAILSVRVLGARNRPPRHFGHVVGLLLALFAGCLSGTMATYPFRPVGGLLEATVWLFGNMLGVLTVAPQVMRLRYAWDASAAHCGLRIEPGYVLSLIGCAALAMLELRYGYGLAIPLLMAAMVGMTVRYGQSAIGMTILVYFVVVSAQDGEGAAFLADLTMLERMFVLQIGMLSMFAAALPMTFVLLKREQMQLELIARNASMHENLMLLDLSEELAGIGRWRFDFVSGEQDWSPRMLELTGLSPDLGPQPGEMWHVMSDGGAELRGQIEANAEARDPFQFDLTIRPPDEPERILRASILNEFDHTGRRIALFGVAMDVTEQVRRVQALDLARGRAERLAAEAQKLANTDPLTGLPNRRCTFSRLASMVEVAHKQGAALAALMFDIDHFKGINDTYGHQTGDEVIVQVAELARRQARQGDVVGRIGGEEFVWLVAGLDAAGARRLAERLRSSVEQGIEGSALPNVTISIGLANFVPSDTGEGLLARADAALYEAKESGRNQVRRAA